MSRAGEDGSRYMASASADRFVRPRVEVGTRSECERPRINKKRTVVLIGNYEGEKGSMDRFRRILEGGLSWEESDWEIITIRPRKIIGAINDRGKVGKWLSYVDKYLLFPLALKRILKRIGRRPEETICHICDHSNAVYYWILRRRPVVVTVHDLIAVKSAMGFFDGKRVGWKGRLLQRVIASGLRRCEFRACVSESTALDLEEVCGQSARLRSRVIPLCVDPAVWEVAEETRAGRDDTERWRREIGGRYIVHVGANVWYKGRDRCLDIYQALRGLVPDPPLLVFAGERAGEVYGFRHPVFRDGWARDVGWLSDRDLCLLYHEAELLLFPSLYEGFGWPILEAQACGCRVVTTDRPPMTEIGGEAAVYINPDDVKGSARKVVALLNEDETSKRKRILAGLANARRFSVSRMVAEYLGVYEELWMSMREKNTVGGRKVENVENMCAKAMLWLLRKKTAWERLRELAHEYSCAGHGDSTDGMMGSSR